MSAQYIIGVFVATLLAIAVIWVFFLGGFETMICGWLELDYLAVCS
jgi:hypothetical protein